MTDRAFVDALAEAMADAAIQNQLGSRLGPEFWKASAGWWADIAVEVLDAAGAFPHYTSTYCIHGLHGDCRLTCKHCEAPCRCSCHYSPGLSRASVLTTD